MTHIEIGEDTKMATTEFQKCCQCNCMTSVWHRVYSNVYCEECFCHFISRVMIENNDLKKQIDKLNKDIEEMKTDIENQLLEETFGGEA